MELWIRSQNRLSNFKSNSQVVRRIGHEDGREEFVILNNDKMNELLGSYKTKERALEVLDEISDIFKPKFDVDVDSVKLSSPSKNDTVINASCKCDVLRLDTYLYEMPKE